MVKMVTLYYHNNKRNIKYKGHINEKGKYHGKGKLFRNGQDIDHLIYEGQFENGKYNGKGILYEFARIDNGWWRNHKKYEGEFLKGKFNGKGILYYTHYQYYKRTRFQPILYKGDFENGEKNGKGILYYKPPQHLKRQKRYYIGSFKNGKFDGKGKTYSENGDLIYDGLWEDGEEVIHKRITNANKLLEKEEYKKYYDEAEEKGFLDYQYNLIRSPVKLETKDNNNQKFKQENIYQLKDIMSLPEPRTSPLTRRTIIKYNIDKKAKKDILDFVGKIQKQAK